MRILVTTVQRSPRKDVDRNFPYIYVLDGHTGNIFKQFAGPRPGWSLVSQTGHSHGARGIELFNDLLYIADWDGRLSWYDPETYRLIGSKILDNVHGVHTIRAYDDLLHITSTREDSIVRLNTKHQIADISDIQSKAGAFIDQFIYEQEDSSRCNQSDLNSWYYDRLHINSLAWDKDGNEYHVYHNLDAIFNFTRQEFVWYGDPLLQRPHDLEFFQDMIICNSSGTCATLAMDLHTQETTIINDNEPHIPSGAPWNLWGMTRGLRIIGDKILIGNTPFSISEFEFLNNTFVLSRHISVDTKESQSIFDICVTSEETNA